MNARLLLCFLLVLSGGWTGCTTIDGQPLKSSAADARQYFQTYLDQCAEDEVRCLWFLQDDPRIGMEMTLKLRTKTVETARDHYLRSRDQLTEHTLDDLDIRQIGQIISHLPPPDASSPYGSTLFVAVRNGGATRVSAYDRHFSPGGVRELYRIAGAYFYSDEQD